MEIGTPIAGDPVGGRAQGKSKYEPAFEAAVAGKGAWVPITFQSQAEALLFFNAAKQFTSRPGKYHGMEATKRREVVYVRMPMLRAVSA